MTNPAPDSFNNLMDRIENDFKFHPATEQTGPMHDRVRATLREVAKIAASQFGPHNTREMALGLTALGEAMHWFNANVAKYGKKS